MSIFALSMCKPIFMMSYPWGDTRRFNSYTAYFRKHFGGRVQKVAIHAGFTCPNRDGAVGYGGCTYCDNDAFNPSYCDPKKPVIQQIKEGIEFHRFRYRRAKKFLAYFQPYSNTHAPLDKLKALFEGALSHPDVIGLVIGTRPDCMDDRKLDYLARLAEQYYIIVEYGLESCYNKTLERINRGHSFEQSVATLQKTASFGIKTGAHLIFGLPGETRSQMLDEAETVSSLPIHNIKFHQLQIVKNTEMEQEYQKNPGDFHLFTLEGYFDFFVEFIERLNPAFIVERFTGEVPPRFIAGPDWGVIRYDRVQAMFEAKLEEKNTWQGKFYRGQQ